MKTKNWAAKEGYGICICGESCKQEIFTNTDLETDSDFLTCLPA